MCGSLVVDLTKQYYSVAIPLIHSLESCLQLLMIVGNHTRLVNSLNCNFVPANVEEVLLLRTSISAS
jgi:hypothetical protein